MDKNAYNNFVLSVRPCVRIFHLYWKTNRTFFLEVWIWRGNIRTYSVGCNKLTGLLCVCVCVLCTFTWHDLLYLDTFLIFMRRANEDISIWSQHYCCRPIEYFAHTKAPLELFLRFQKHGHFLILHVEGIHVLWNLQTSDSVCDLDCLRDIYWKTLPVILGCVIPVVCRKTNGEVNVSQETQLW